MGEFESRSVKTRDAVYQNAYARSTMSLIGTLRGDGLLISFIIKGFKSKSVKTRDAVEGFHLLENSHKFCRGFHQAMKARITCLFLL
mgnify:CR=1 FL=1